MIANRKIRLRNFRSAMVALAGVALAASLAGPALATTVEVTLADRGANADMPTGLGMGMPGADMSKAPMTISALPATVEAGPVTFDVTNISKDLVHEMIVVPVEAGITQLPYDANNEAVDETKTVS